MSESLTHAWTDLVYPAYAPLPHKPSNILDQSHAHLVSQVFSPKGTGARPALSQKNNTYQQKPGLSKLLRALLRHFICYRVSILTHCFKCCLACWVTWSRSDCTKRLLQSLQLLWKSVKTIVYSISDSKNSMRVCYSQNSDGFARLSDRVHKMKQLYPFSSVEVLWCA